MLAGSLFLLRGKGSSTSPETDKKKKQRLTSHSLVVITILFILCWLTLTAVVYTSTNRELVTNHSFQYISAILVLCLAITILFIALLQVGLPRYIMNQLHFSSSVELKLRKNYRQNSAKSNLVPQAQVRHIDSPLPSPPPLEYQPPPEYFTIANDGHVFPPLQDPPRHRIEVDSQENDIPPLGSESDQDFEFTSDCREFKQSERDAQDDMVENTDYGVHIPNVGEELTPPFERCVGPDPEGLSQQEDDINVTDEDEVPIDKNWFKDGTFSPFHQPCSPSSSTTFTPGTYIPNIANVDDQELEILYQKARACSPSPPTSSQASNGQYARIRQVPMACNPAYYPHPPSTSSIPSVVSIPWYQTGDSELNYPPNSAADTHVPYCHELDSDEVTRPLPSPPPPLPPRTLDSHEDEQGGYAEISSLSPNHGR